MKKANGGLILFSMGHIGNVEDVSDMESAGNKIACKVYLIETKQVDQTVPFPKPNKRRELADIPLKAGECMHYFEAHNNPTEGSNGEAGDVTTNVTNTFTLIMAGNRDQLLNFIEQKAGGKFILIYEDVDTGELYCQGTTAQPLRLKKFERKNDKDARIITFTFENNSFKQPVKYVGSIVRKEPVRVAAGATILALKADNYRYELSAANSAETEITTHTGITSSMLSETITVIGTGGEHPTTIVDNDHFVLKDGATWTGRAGSRISFQIFDQTTLVETDRVEK